MTRCKYLIRFVFMIVIALLLRPPFSHAQGMMIRKGPSLEPLELRSHRVEANIKEGASKTTVTQVFRNNCATPIEATYIFPLPPDAAISNFALWIEGKKKEGEILEKNEAAKIYQQIVSRLKDPGLLDYMGGKIFRARVFPIPPGGDQKVEISFTQLVPSYKNLYKYLYPLKTSGTPVKTKEDFTFTATIEASHPIKAIYSPTHDIEVQMNGPKGATIGLEMNQATLGRDFVLYFNVTEERVGLSLLAHKKGKKEGSFLLMLSPGAETEESEIVDKHVTFVLDTSGSMNGDKIKSAKKALLYCLERLRPQERFNLIRFSSTAQQIFDSPVQAGKSEKEEAASRIESMSAAGGTAIESALRLALQQQDGGMGLPHFVVFITDGMPTVGETDPQKILRIVKEINKGGTSRIFVFGLGEDVNANFLDLLAQENGGVARYADSGDKLEVVLERFYNAISHPAMTDVSLALVGITSSDLFPQKMPDLFYGEQLTVVGRYLGGGEAKIILEGRVGNKIKRITYTKSFPNEEEENDFIEHIWATRKVGYLLDQIRLNGESQELKDEVIALARTYGIVTPYTSYLVVEDDVGPLPEEPPLPPLPSPIYPTPYYEPYPLPSKIGIDPPAASPDLRKKYGAMKSLSESAGNLSSERSRGREGAAMSEVLSDMKNAEQLTMGPTKLAHGRLFVWRSGRWVDSNYKKGMKLLRVKFGSEGFFRLIELRPELKKFLSIGTDVIVVVSDKKAISVETTTEESPSEGEITEFLAGGKL